MREIRYQTWDSDVVEEDLGVEGGGVGAPSILGVSDSKRR